MFVKVKEFLGFRDIVPVSSFVRDNKPDLLRLTRKLEQAEVEVREHICREVKEHELNDHWIVD